MFIVAGEFSDRSDRQRRAVWSEPPSIEALGVAFPQLEIVGLIGRGGMGFVFKARQPKLDRLVALKILAENAVRRSSFSERASKRRLLRRFTIRLRSRFRRNCNICFGS